MIDVLVTLGSNIEPELNYPKALALLTAHVDLVLKHGSSVMKSVAVGSDGLPNGQDPYHNGAVWVQTALSPDGLRTTLRHIEEVLGRTRSEDKFSARPIDLDIAFYGDWVLETEHLSIPDPDILRFTHLAQPLAEIAPEWVHPITNQSLREIADALTSSKVDAT